MNIAIVESGYNNYLASRPWDVYLTVTFRKVGIESAEALRQLRRFLKRLNTPECVFYKKFVQGFAVTEYQGRRESVHIHSVINGISPEKVPLLDRRCKDIFGESKAVAYDYGRPMSASKYLANKCAQGAVEDWTFLKINSKWRGSKR